MFSAFQRFLVKLTGQCTGHRSFLTLAVHSAEAGHTATLVPIDAVVAAGAVLARFGRAFVDVDCASFAHESWRAGALEGVDEVRAAGAVETGFRLALIDVDYSRKESVTSCTSHSSQLRVRVQMKRTHFHNELL